MIVRWRARETHGLLRAAALHYLASGRLTEAAAIHHALYAPQRAAAARRTRDEKGRFK